MSDLSHLLGAVYGDADGPPARHVPAPPVEVPEWADDSHLDEVFADWLPGPGPEASAMERNLMAHASEPAPPARQSIDDDLAAALSAALVDANRPARPQATPPRPAAGRTTPLRPLVDWDTPPAARAPAPAAPPARPAPAPAPSYAPPAAASYAPPATAPAPAPAPAPAAPHAAAAPFAAHVAPPAPARPGAGSHDWTPDAHVIAPASAIAAHKPWSPGDDDITPGRNQKRGRRR